MRHATRNQRLSRPTEQKDALVHNLVRSLMLHGQIQTTRARAKEAQRLADRLVSLGKEGSIHARRRAFRVLQDRMLVGQLFADIAPRFGDVAGGYTRVVRLSLRRGDGAQQALLAFSRLPAPTPAAPKAKTQEAPKAPAPAPGAPEKPAKAAEKPKGLLEGLRGLWKRKKGSAAT
ncbi:MAG: 50S ribosomal protein L17 [Candidatus Omnitrophica bacterium]|nr:50S ribosomal protein L17 [Candidatus Omnitrophota bacterium]